MQKEAEQQLINLAGGLYTLRELPQEGHSRDNYGYILFIGGEASTIQNRPFIDELQYQALLTWRNGRRFSLDEISNISPTDRLQLFNEKWLAPGANLLKNGTLRELLNKLVFTQGHMDLADLLKAHYFSVVLTTTIDQLIESALISSFVQHGQPAPQWSVLVNGHTIPDDFQRILQSASGTTILKLCGNIQNPAITRFEVEEKLHLIEQTVEGVLQRNLIIVGLTSLDDLMLQSFSHLGDGESIHFIGSRPPSAELKRLLRQRDPIYIVDEELNFDLTFQTIYEQIKLFSEAERATGRPLLEADVERLRKAQEENPTAQGALSGYIRTEPSRRTAGTNIQNIEHPPIQTPVRGQTRQNIEVDENEESLIELLPVEQTEDNLATLIDTTVFTVKLGTNRKASFTVMGGAFNYTSEMDSKELDIDLDELNEFMQDMGRNLATYHKLSANSSEQEAERKLGLESWRRQAKREGRLLYTNIVQVYPDLNNMLGVAQLAAQKDGPENLTLVFDGSREYLGMPYELLHDGKAPLVVSNPLCRRLSGLNSHNAQDFDSFVQWLRKKNLPLKILFISAGTKNISSDKEIDELQKRISQQAGRLKLKLEVKIISTTQATYDAVRKQLEKCSYHIVHYAGHGTYNDTTGEDSGLRLRRKENSEDRVTLTARDIANLMAASETHLFYLNTCVGAWTGSDLLLRNYDYLGVMDAIARAGVPYVLGFRWYVTDSGSRRFAAHFYNYLFQQPLVPERAVWYARQQIYMEKGNDETWMSPILVAQNPYR